MILFIDPHAKILGSTNKVNFGEGEEVREGNDRNKGKEEKKVERRRGGK